MHELSLALSILDATSQEMAKNDAGRVQEIKLEVGMLSGVDPEALKFALSVAMESSILEGASVIISSTEGVGQCSQCDHSFPMPEMWTTCPVCRMPAGKILQGEELKIVSLTVDR
ncbi:MAG: hydrogenase maturation nickel metallochaperone HypA [Bacteroidales bacterium]|nr:hydrogenase maturation nickel metallochaperone HypA [Bacteroidales bacterium]